VAAPEGAKSDRRVAGVAQLVWTGYVGQRHARVQALSSGLASELLLRHPSLLRRIYGLANAVVREHDIDGRLTPPTEGRFLHLLTEWRSVVAGVRCVVESAVHEANGLVDCYWATLARRHPKLKPPGGSATRPLPAIVPADWVHPDQLLMLAFGTAASVDPVTRRAGRVLARALEIVGEYEPAVDDDPAHGSEAA
jgi:hypothetical protein